MRRNSAAVQLSRSIHYRNGRWNARVRKRWEGHIETIPQHRNWGSALVDPSITGCCATADSVRYDFEKDRCAAIRPSTINIVPSVGFAVEQETSTVINDLACQCLGDREWRAVLPRRLQRGWLALFNNQCADTRHDDWLSPQSH